MPRSGWAQKALGKLRGGELYRRYAAELELILEISLEHHREFERVSAEMEEAMDRGDDPMAARLMVRTEAAMKAALRKATEAG